jgi:sporulation protein YlmC with PRC-barrel domain
MKDTRRIEVASQRRSAMTRFPLIAVVAVSLSSAAFAQGSPPPDSKKEAPTAAQPTQPSNQTTGITAAPTAGLKIANTASVAVRFVEVKPADFLATKLLGINVYNNQDESLGEIQDIVFADGKSVTGVIVSVGGLLGLGESYIVLDPATIVLNQKDGSWRAYVDMTKDNLKNAPKFTYGEKT